MPPTFDLARYPTVETIRLLASLLERMTAANDQLNRAASARKTNARRASSASLLASSNDKPTADPPTDNYTRFHARTIPSIDIYSYLSRIFKYCPCANECFLSLLVYFDRMSKNALAQNGRPLTIDSYNIHRLIIAGVMVSSKFFSDVFYTNTRYAKVGGLPVAELNSLELEFLVLNNFNLSVPISELQRYGDQLLKVGMMEQEMMKSIIYETPSPFPTPNRHARSTSAGSAVLARQDTMPTTKRSTVTMDQLCDMTARVSLDESNRPRMIVFPSSAQPQQQQQQAAALAAAAGVNAPPVVRRMASLSNLHHSPHYFYNTPMTSTESLHSPVTLDPLEEDANRSANNGYAFCTQQQQQQQQQQQHPLSRSSPPKNASFDAISYRRSQRHSFVVNGAELWRHSSSSPPLPQQYTRQRHGSMGYTIAGTTNPEGWNQHRLPRQSRSSINLHQQAGFQRKATPPPQPSGMMPCPGELNEAGFAFSGGYGPYYHPLGIPTPPPSSSPVHYYKTQGNTPSPYSSSATTAATTAAYHPSNPTSVMYL